MNENLAKTRVTFECQFCLTKFSRAITARTFEVKCPKCGEYDVWPVGA